MIIGIPVVGRPELTDVCIEHLNATKKLSTTKIVVIDNGSDPAYDADKYSEFIRNEENIGYYRPLKQLFDLYPDEEYLGLMHNDLMLYTEGWDQRMEEAFQQDPQLGLIGLCGSKEVDERGGRGGYTVCNFMGHDVAVGDEIWKGQDPSAGRRIDGIEPALVLDSLFMMFRRPVIKKLAPPHDSWENITLAHFYDRIWPIRTVEHGWHVVTMGIDCDHIGGLTTTANERYRDDCIKWLDDRNIPWREDNSGIIAAERLDPRNIPCGNPETQMYLVAESRYLSEYKDDKNFLPAIILDGGYDVRYLAR